MSKTIRRIRSALQLVFAVLLMVAAWGLGAFWVLGLFLDTTVLTSSLPDGTPAWPLHVGIVLASLFIGTGGLRLTQSVLRRWKLPSVAARKRTPFEVRRNLFLLGALALSITAIFAGMIGEWMGEEPQGLTGPGTLLAFATMAGSLALGIAFARRIAITRAERVQAKDPSLADEDGRPVLALIWWPITIISIVVPLVVIYFTVVRDIAPGSGLPTGITLVVGVFGFISLAPVIVTSWTQFVGRGIRGFWGAARNTEWGEGM